MLKRKIIYLQLLQHDAFDPLGDSRNDFIGNGLGG